MSGHRTCNGCSRPLPVLRALLQLPVRLLDLRPTGPLSLGDPPSFFGNELLPRKSAVGTPAAAANSMAEQSRAEP